MIVGLVGAGNMARALARGWGDPVLATDGGSGRAAALAQELGGEALDSNAELSRRAEVVVLCHKPAQLQAVAAEVAGGPRAVASVLAGVTLSELRAAYGDTPVFRFMPNTPVELRAGVTCRARDDAADPELGAAVEELFERVGTIVRVPEEQMEVATALMGCGPAYLALAVEAQVAAAAARGVEPTTAARLAVETMAGTAALLRARGDDAAAVRHEVTSPGGLTEKGLRALQDGGLAEAFEAATAAVAGTARP